MRLRFQGKGKASLSWSFLAIHFLVLPNLSNSHHPRRYLWRLSRNACIPMTSYGPMNLMISHDQTGARGVSFSLSHRGSQQIDGLRIYILSPVCKSPMSSPTPLYSPACLSPQEESWSVTNRRGVTRFSGDSAHRPFAPRTARDVVGLFGRAIPVPRQRDPKRTSNKPSFDAMPGNKTQGEVWK